MRLATGKTSDEQDEALVFEVKKLEHERDQLKAKMDEIREMFKMPTPPSETPTCDGYGGW
jgi:uncharacterized protein Yka (UPF0111/DUF47 family)